MYSYNCEFSKQQFFNEANKYLQFLLTNATSFKKYEALNALIVVRNEIDKNPDIYSNFYVYDDKSSLESDLYLKELNYIYKNGNKDSKNEALDWLFEMVDETENQNKLNGNNIIKFPTLH